MFRKRKKRIDEQDIENKIYSILDKRLELESFKLENIAYKEAKKVMDKERDYMIDDVAEKTRLELEDKLERIADEALDAVVKRNLTKLENELLMELVRRSVGVNLPRASQQAERYQETRGSMEV